MDRSAHYRDQAARCARLASSCLDGTTREKLLTLAAEHSALADGLARTEQQSASTFRSGSQQQG